MTSAIESDIRPEEYAAYPSPCYVVEERLLRRNLQTIRDVAQAAGVEIILAFKAFALWKTFPIVGQYVSHTTASSLSEARLAREVFGSPAHTYSPAYTDAEFPTLLRCSSHVTFNSLTQYAHFYPQVERHNAAQAEAGRVTCGLRVNPEYSEIETLIYNPCAPGSRFGVLADALPATLPPGIEGFHCHCHCESSALALAHTLEHLEAKFGRWFPQIQWLNLGGGHLMTRRGYDLKLLISLLRGLRDRYPWLKVILEPGSAFAWQTGPLISQVVDVVENHGIATAILNVSFACHMPDCLEMPYHPQIRGARLLIDDEAEGASGLSTDASIEAEGASGPSIDAPLSPDKADDGGANGGYRYRMGGNSCLSGDYMGTWAFDHPLRVGDYIVFEDMIHYTTVKTTMFNGVSHPAIAMRRADGRIDILRRFGYEDYRDRMD